MPVSNDNKDRLIAILIFLVTNSNWDWTPIIANNYINRSGLDPDQIERREITMKEVTLTKKVKCQVCKERTAKFDGKTINGPWAYMCIDCFIDLGVGLGTGKGQAIKYTDN